MRMELSIQITATPTSANTAIHMLAIPRAPSTRQLNLTNNKSNMKRPKLHSKMPKMTMIAR